MRRRNRVANALTSALPRSLAVALPLVAADSGVQAQPADPASSRNFSVHAGQRLTSDDNLFRLPDGLDASSLLGPGATRDEVISTTFVSLDGHWEQSRQEVRLDAEAATNRFAEYRLLDNSSGLVDVDWRFSAGSRWSGHAGGQRRRTLSSFANTSALDKDLVDTGSYEAGLRFALGPRWATTADWRRSSTRHGSDARREDDVDVDLDRLGIEFRTPAGTTLSWRYGESRAQFATAAPGGTGSVSDYRERTADFGLAHELASKIAVRARVGRLDRTYALAGDFDFSGNTWNAALVWSPTVKTQVAISRWRELRANLDAEAQHFSSTGAGLTVAWSPIHSVAVSYDVTSEEQHYLTTLAEPGGPPERFDESIARTLGFAWFPRERFSLDLSYRNDIRDSNRPRFAYAADQISIGVELSF